MVRSTANTDFCPITPKYCVIYQHWNVRQLSCRSASSGSIARRLRRSEEHTSELQSLMRISYAVFFLKQKREATHWGLKMCRHRNRLKSNVKNDKTNKIQK